MENITQPARQLKHRTPIDERMRIHNDGQVTWPEPLLNETCGRCAFFDGHNVSNGQVAKGMGRCRRVAIMHGRWGKQIHERLTACSEFGIDGGGKK